MRLSITTLVAPIITAIIYGTNAEPAGGGGELYPPGYLPLVSRANALLSAGQFNDAAKAYSEAIDMAPNDYLLYYKRATAYYSSNRHPQALEDFDKVLDLTSNTFDKAYLMKARIHAKEGQFPAARDALKKYSTKSPEDPAMREILFGVAEAEMAVKKAAQAMKAEMWQACVEACSTALHTASHSVELREQRVNCQVAAGDIEGAAGDLTRLSHLSVPTTTLLMKTFRLAYFLLPYGSTSSAQAMGALKQCLHRDPDSKDCLPAHRLIKKFDKTFAKLDTAMTEENWKAVIDLLIGSDAASGFAATFDDVLGKNINHEALAMPAHIPLRPALSVSPRREAILRALCRAYTNLKQWDQVEQWCGSLTRMDGLENDPDALIGQGEVALKKEEWEEAVRLFEKAFQATGRSSRDIQQRLVRAQKLLKQSRQKDYYKVLGVARDADTKTIKKAFRTAAKQAHPDKGGSEAKMAAVNEAYEVLSDPELRQRFDNGDDPNDPMAQQGGHPFTGGFPGGGGFPFQFFQQGGSGGGGGPFQFFQQGGGGGGFQFHHSPPGHHGRGH